MTVTEQPQRNADHPTDPAQPTPAGQPVTVAELVRTRQYEIGPTHEQVRTWRTQVGELVGALAP